jgi:hypothetical protein
MEPQFSPTRYQILERLTRAKITSMTATLNLSKDLVMGLANVVFKNSD